MVDRRSAAVAVHDLRFAYADAGPLVLDGVSLEVPGGSVTALLGPNGSGKTTLLHLMLGLLVPHAGQVTLAGRPQDSYGRREVGRMLALVPQVEQVTFDLNVYEYALTGRAPHLGLLARPTARDRRAVLRALETVGIAALWERAVPSLSGGERQLAMVARAVAQEARVVLFDEPTSHLDIGNARQVLDLIRRLAAEGRAVVLTTHDPNAAAAVADQVALLRQGRLLAAGLPDVVLTPALLSATYGVPIDVLDEQRRRILAY